MSNMIDENSLVILHRGKRYLNLSLFVSILIKKFKFYDRKRISDKVIVSPFKRNIKGKIIEFLANNRIVVETKNGSLYNVHLDEVQKYKKEGWKKGKMRSKETCEKMSKSRMGRNNHRYQLRLHWKR
jgi:hypothetical protein